VCTVPVDHGQTADIKKLDRGRMDLDYVLVQIPSGKGTNYVCNFRLFLLIMMEGHFFLKEKSEKDEIRGGNLNVPRS
jgi:hypothetical protein